MQWSVPERVDAVVCTREGGCSGLYQSGWMQWSVPERVDAVVCTREGGCSGLYQRGWMQWSVPERVDAVVKYILFIVFGSSGR